MRKRTKAQRLDGAAAWFIDDQLASGRVAFPHSALVQKTGLSIVAAKNQLLRLRDQVTRVTRVLSFF